jgi:hypothetical protein
MAGLYMNDEPERTWKEQVVAYWRCCFGIYLEGLRDTMI